jgi:hypothetical protein
MKSILKLISFLALGFVIIPPILYLAGSLTKPPMISLMLAGTLAWFASVPWWMGRGESV